MKRLRSLLDELIEHRLWPVAVALVAGLVIVPVVLSKKASAPEPAPLASTGNVATIASPDAAAASDTQAGTGSWLPKLSKHDPFVQHGGKAAGAGDSAASPSPPTSGDTAGALTPPFGDTGSTIAPAPVSPSFGGGSSTGSFPPVGGSTPVPPQHKPSPKTTPTLALRFGAVGKSMKDYKLEAMEALPSSTSPVAIYVGLDKGTKTAVFIVPYNVKAEGDGKCVPNPKNCQTVHIAPGDTEFFDYTSDAGAVTQYQLDYVGVKAKKTSSEKAKAAYVSTSAAARRALRRTLIRHGLGRAISEVNFATAFPAPQPRLHPAGPSGATLASPGVADSLVAPLTPLHPVGPSGAPAAVAPLP